MIEIKELVVRANVIETPVDPSGQKGNTRGKNAVGNTWEGINEDVIESCVRQVLAILERQKER